MTTSTLVPLSEYLHSSYHPDREWVDGEVRERNMGEWPHASVQKFFLKFFLLREEGLGVRVYPELRLQVSERNYRVPDVMVMLEDDPAEDIVRVPPLLCVEVLSVEDRMSQMHEKVDDYLGMGIRCVWVVDPRRRNAFMTVDGMLLPADTLSLPGFTFTIQVAEAFAEMDRLAAKAV